MNNLKKKSSSQKVVEQQILKLLCSETPEKEEWLLVIDSLFNERNDSSNYELVEQSNDCSGLYDIPDFTTTYMSGYIAFKASRWTKCKECISSLKTENFQVQLEQKMINVLLKGYLTHPSKSPEKLITILETTILKTLKVTNLNADILFEISYALQDYTLLLVGCMNHAESLSFLSTADESSICNQCKLDQAMSFQ
ncbi:hypothetical protein HCN44_000443 [Aphidius gifuensis]|uniref:Uncharacterized protein n=1 Tax=Aphidius gifuensis TaxID=684658 RepID=A0A834XQB0_APHGI|nr:hypothetical protein HCN44_000443 [Aphidius gifuensis]